VKAIAKLPNFRYDLKMLNEGERSFDVHGAGIAAGERGQGICSVCI
jgi:hypothetical protein